MLEDLPFVLQFKIKTKKIPTNIEQTRSKQIEV